MSTRAPDPAPRQDDEADGLLTVTELAKQLCVTPRAIRFYETKGLITPARAGANRVYARRDKARMILILRGKRLGFTLRDIRAFLDLYDADPTGKVQMQSLLDAIQRRRRDLEDQRRALAETFMELDDLEQQALERLETPPKSRRKAG